jgi:hypothetical protein
MQALNTRAKSGWHSFDGGNSIGQRGSEDGIILRDEEHSLGARITLERDGYTPFAITCGIYGWMVHTRFFSSRLEAQRAFEDMKTELARILDLVPYTDDPQVNRKARTVEQAIRRFLQRFP